MKYNYVNYKEKYFKTPEKLNKKVYSNREEQAIKETVAVFKKHSRYLLCNSKNTLNYKLTTRKLYKF